MGASVVLYRLVINDLSQRKFHAILAPPKLSSRPNSRKGTRRKDEAMTYKLREKRMTTMTMAPSRDCGFANEGLAFISDSSSCKTERKASALSSSSTFPLDARNNNTGGSRVSSVSQARVPRLDEPFLYDIPADLKPVYQTPPLLLRVIVWASSALLAGREFISQVVSAASVSQITHSIREQAPATMARKVATFVLRYLLFATIAKLSIQERFFAPSRVSTKYLVDNDQLPSELSRYETIIPRSTWGGTKHVHNDIGVHSIQYTKSAKENQDDELLPKFDGIYLHHGFGASSLSWIPVLPSLVNKLGKVGAPGIANDNPGFGFSDRPDGDTDEGLAQYSSEGNAGIALSLLDRHVKEERDDESRSVAIFGHSMGSKAALLMALTCAKEPQLNLKPSLLVLVAPALEGLALPARKSSTKKKKSLQTTRCAWLRSILSSIRVLWRKVFLDYPIKFGLKRLVGRAGFWRRGLELAWGSGRLSDSDVLRFQWPSIGSGWEQGLINFSRSKLFSASVLDDMQLLREVASNDETTVVIVYGSKDRVIPIEGSVAEEIRHSFPNIKLIRMEDLGHDPFEEDVHGFMSELEKALQDND